jgi:hypothetical protein
MLLELAIVFVSLNSMRYKANYEYLDKYSRESGIPVYLLVVTLLLQLIAAGLFTYSFWWPTANMIASCIDLPSAVIGAYVSGTKKNPTPHDISFLNQQIIAAAIFLGFLLHY